MTSNGIKKNRGAPTHLHALHGRRMTLLWCIVVLYATPLFAISDVRIERNGESRSSWSFCVGEQDGSAPNDTVFFTAIAQGVMSGFNHLVDWEVSGQGAAIDSVFETDNGAPAITIAVDTTNARGLTLTATAKNSQDPKTDNASSSVDVDIVDVTNVILFPYNTICADGISSTHAIANTIPSGRDVVWSIEGYNFGATIDPDSGEITSGMFGGTITIKAVDAEVGECASASANLDLVTIRLQPASSRVVRPSDCLPASTPMPSETAISVSTTPSDIDPNLSIKPNEGEKIGDLTQDSTGEWQYAAPEEDMDNANTPSTVAVEIEANLQGSATICGSTTIDVYSGYAALCRKVSASPQDRRRIYEFIKCKYDKCYDDFSSLPDPGDVSFPNSGSSSCRDGTRVEDTILGRELIICPGELCGDENTFASILVQEFVHWNQRGGCFNFPSQPDLCECEALCKELQLRHCTGILGETRLSAVRREILDRCPGNARRPQQRCVQFTTE